MDIKAKWDKVRHAVNSPRGRNIASFSVFLVIAAILWMVMMLNEENQMEVRCRIRLKNVPDSVTLISNVPEDITAAVQAKNSVLLRYKWSDDPVVDVEFGQFSIGDRLLVQPADFKGLVRNCIGGQAVISSMSPDSLSLYYTTRSPKILPVEIEGRISVDPNAILTGPIVVEPDTVSVYSIEQLQSGINSIETENFRLTSLTQTTMVSVRLVAPQRTRIIPSTVTITIPIESLIECFVEAPIQMKNAPKNVDAIIFPANAMVKYRVPQSLIDSVPEVKVTVDYRDIPYQHKFGAAYRMKTTVHVEGDIFHSIAVEPDSVECILEKD